MNKERLQNVIRAIREGRKEDFSMTSWATPCSSPACALGHYAFRQDLQEVFKLHSNAVFIGASSQPDAVYGGVAMHFDISGDEARDLFASSGCRRVGNDENITAEDAMEYFENFIAEHEVVEAIEEVTAEVTAERLQEVNPCESVLQR